MNGNLHYFIYKNKQPIQILHLDPITNTPMVLLLESTDSTQQTGAIRRKKSNRGGDWAEPLTLTEVKKKFHCTPLALAPCNQLFSTQNVLMAGV